MPRAKQSEKRRSLKRGEILAMHPEAIRRDDRGAFFFLFGPSIARNERTGQDDKVAVVNVRGPLDQFSDCWGDNYESITNRVIEAMTGVDQVRELKRKRQEAYWMGETDEIDRSEIEPAPPKAVVLRLSSPGGVVSGLWECVKKLRALSEEHGVPLVAYVDEMAASAAYALACACDTIYLPESGIVGSIGVISHMFSVARANDEDGIDVEVIASGDQKVDGNENLPITDAAKSREYTRVMKLARQFFRVVASARGLSPGEVEAFQAGIFLGDDGVDVGLADAVMGWDAFLDEISLAYEGSAVTHSNTAQHGSIGTTARSSIMTQLLALIAQTKKDLAKAKGAERKTLSDKLARLSASLNDLQAYKKTTKKMEETKEESEDPPEEEESEDDEKDKDADDDAESEESDEDAEGDDKDKDAEGDDDKKESKRSRKSDDDAESDDDKKDAEGDDADDEALLASIRDPKKRGQLAARLGEARAGRQALAEVRKLASERKREKRNALIESKLAGHFITKSEAKWLKTQPAATVSSFLATRKKPILRTDETAEIPSDSGRPDVAAHISDQEFKMIEAAYLASGGKVSLEKFVEDYKRGAYKPNGVAGAHTTPNGGSR